jgi:tetratricopeptide (TPR) repeat protein
MAMARTVLAKLLLRRREFARAENDLMAACTHFEAHDQPRWLAWALRMLGVTRWRAGDYPAAVEALLRAQSLLEALDNSWELAQVAYALAGIAFEQGNIADAQVRAEQALRLYEVTGDRRSVASIKGNLALVYDHLGLFQQALEYNQANLENARNLGDRHAISIALGNRAAIFQDMGDLNAAQTCLQEALEVAEAMGNQWEAARHGAFIAQLNYLAGQHDLALAQFEHSLPVLRAGGAPYYVVGPLLNAAELQIARGRLREAGDLTREGATLAADLNLADELIRAQDLEAQIATAQGDISRSDGRRRG